MFAVSVSHAQSGVGLKERIGHGADSVLVHPNQDGVSLLELVLMQSRLELHLAVMKLVKREEERA